MNLSIQIFEWPTRFLVEADTPDRSYYKFWPDAEVEIWPHFVDLEIYDDGWCSCDDFRFEVEPYLSWPKHRRECIHIIAAKRYHALSGGKQPKQMPHLVNYESL